MPNFLVNVHYYLLLYHVLPNIIETLVFITKLRIYSCVLISVVFQIQQLYWKVNNACNCRRRSKKKSARGAAR